MVPVALLNKMLFYFNSGKAFMETEMEIILNNFCLHYSYVIQMWTGLHCTSECVYYPVASPHRLLGLCSCALIGRRRPRVAVTLPGGGCEAGGGGDWVGRVRVAQPLVPPLRGGGDWVVLMGRPSEETGVFTLNDICFRAEEQLTGTTEHRTACRAHKPLIRQMINHDKTFCVVFRDHEITKAGNKLT